MLSNSNTYFKSIKKKAQLKLNKYHFINIIKKYHYELFCYVFEKQMYHLQTGIRANEIVFHCFWRVFLFIYKISSNLFFVIPTKAR